MIRLDYQINHQNASLRVHDFERELTKHGYSPECRHNTHRLGDPGRMLIPETGRHSAPRQMSVLSCAIISVHAHSWGLDEAKAFPPLHSFEECFVTFARLAEIRIWPFVSSGVQYLL